MRPSQGVGFYRTCGGRLGALAKARRRRVGWKRHELHADSTPLFRLLIPAVGRLVACGAPPPRLFRKLRALLPKHHP